MYYTLMEQVLGKFEEDADGAKGTKDANSKHAGLKAV